MERKQEITAMGGALDTLFCQKGIIKTPSSLSLDLEEDSKTEQITITTTCPTYSHNIYNGRK